MKKRRLKKKFIIFLTIYVFYLTPYLIINSYSKYEGIINKEGSIAIAKWDVSAIIPDTTLNIISENNYQDYIISITNNSEVKVNGFIILSDIPDGILVELNDSEFRYPDRNHQIKFSIELNKDSSFNYQLRFKSDIDSPNLNNYETNIDVILNQEEL